MINISSESLLTQSLTSSEPSSIAVTETEVAFWEEYSLFTNTGFALILFALVLYGKNQTKKMAKAIRSEKHKNQGLQQRLQTVLQDKHKLETNPDLIHSRDWNLDYLRIRMQEDEFRQTTMAKVKIEIEKIFKKYVYNNSYKIDNRKPKIDANFEILRETDISGKPAKRVLFRVKIVALQLPIQATARSIEEILNSIESSFYPTSDPTWQPEIQGKPVFLTWDRQTKPTPLLILESYDDVK